MEKQLTKEQAIAMCESGWWKDKDPIQVVLFQLQQDRLCMEFSEFHRLVGVVLKRPVYTHEFAYPDLLLQEILGERDTPSLTDIMCLIPEDKLITVVASR